jgi:lipoprotein-anchoring transpeptidase ErfK/SrfK
LLLCLLAGLFAYLLIQDLFASGSFPAGVKIVGVSVAGLNRTEAIQECTSELSEVANRPLTLQVDADKYQISARDIGLLLDYRGMVERAYKRAWSVNLFERMGRRFTNRPREVNVSLLAQGDRGRVNGWVSSVINQINRQPRDAYVDVTSGAAVIVKATDGRNANLGELLADSDAALRRPDRTVKVRVGRVPAATTDEAFGRLIIINIAEHKLSLFERERLLAEYPVACGSPTYPSPVGKWKIVEKQMNPTWHNPGSGWASGMPPSIPPGPGNPLGTRALALNAPGVLIHGTPSSWSIGQNVSHGCVRMYMANVEQLFDMVEVNTPVYVTGSAGNPGFDVTAKPFWQK